MKKLTILFALILLTTSAMIAQEIKYDQYGVEVKSTPVKSEVRDGILVFESLNNDYKIWFDTRVQADFAGFFGVNEDYDPIGNGASIRRARFAVKAQLTPNWYGEIDIDLANGLAELKDALVRYDGLKNFEFQVGNFKENFSMSRNTTSRYLLFIERPMASYLAPSRHIGGQIKYSIPLIWATGGVFFQEIAGSEELLNVQDNNKDYGRGTGVSYTGKLVVRPLYKSKNAGLHIGGAISYRTPKSHDAPGDYGGFRYSMRNTTSINRKKYIDTDVIKGAHHSLLYSVELAANYKGLRFESAYIGANVTLNDDSPMANKEDKRFGGWYAQAGYLLLGGTQRYDYGGAKYTRAEQGRSWGDIELAARYETINLNDFDSGIYGGSGEIWALGLNFLVGNNMKFTINYQYVNNDRYANGKNKLFVGHDASGNPTKDYTKVMEEKGKGGVDYSMVALRFQVAF